MLRNRHKKAIPHIASFQLISKSPHYNSKLPVCRNCERENGRNNLHYVNCNHTAGWTEKRFRVGSGLDQSHSVRRTEVPKQEVKVIW